MVHPQNVRFQNVRLQNILFQNVRFLNIRFTKRQVYKTSGFKTSGVKTFGFKTKQKKSIGIAKFAFLFKVENVSFLLITSDCGDIWHKKPSKGEKKMQPSLCLQTWLQQNLRISTNHKYRIYMDVFCNRTF